MAIRWAPLRLPMRRRLQTAAVVLTGLLIPGTVAAVVLAAVLHPTCRLLLLLYIAWAFLIDSATPWRGGRPSRWLRGCALFRQAANYFPSRLRIHPSATAAARGSEPAILCCHPHGVLSAGVLSTLAFNSGEAELGRYRIATISLNVIFPVWREFMLGLGMIDASPVSIIYCLQKGISVVVVVGGAVEALDAAPGTVALTLDKRRGFVRLALQTGVPLIPAFVFGENELFGNLGRDVGIGGTSYFRILQMGIKRVTGFTVPFVRGRGIFQYDAGILPRRVPLSVVCGPPLAARRILQPTEADVAELHSLYIEALKALYAEHASRYAAPTDWSGRVLPIPPLEIVR